MTRLLFIAAALVPLTGCLGTCGTSDVFNTAVGDDLRDMPEECGRRGSFGHEHPEHDRAIFWIVPDAPKGMDLAAFNDYAPAMTIDLPLSALEDKALVRFPDIAGDADVLLAGVDNVVPLVAGEIEILGKAGKTALGDPQYKVRWSAEWEGFDGALRFEAEGQDKISFRSTVLPYAPPITSTR